MINRLLQFLGAENISQSQFADTIGVARASVSHILSGRNKPGYDFIEGIMLHYPALNMEWLITGRGRMYKCSDTGGESLFSEENTVQVGRRIERVVVFYSDNTFQEIR